MSGFLDNIADDDLDAIIAAPVTNPNPKGLEGDFTEACSKCRGTGHFHSYTGRIVGKCYTCKGRGNITYKTSPQQRADGRAYSAATKERTESQNWANFKAEQPGIASWIEGNTFSFAVAMGEAVRKYGYLTNNQLAACFRILEKNDARKAETSARIANARDIDTTAIEAAFSKASQSLKRPTLRVAEFTISHAKATSINAGALYVKSAGQYLGKIMGGKFFRSRECSEAQEADFRTIAADPKEAAIRYGRLTGSCACCGRLLTNKESIARGIGPICAEQFGF